MKCAIYTRVSTEQQAEEELPILGQVEECRKYTEAHGWQITDVYKDEGYSGRNAERPDFQRLLADAKNHLFDKVVCWKGSRIARNVADRFAFHGVLDRCGIDLVSLNEPDVDGAASILIRGMMASVDEYWSRTIAEDTLRGLKALARQGYSAGGRPPKGYIVNREVIGLKRNGEPRFRVKWQPDPEWRERVQLAFQMLLGGHSNQEIIEATGVARNTSSLCTLFRNPTYIGERCFNVHRRKRGRVIKYSYDDPDVVRVPESHEAIISREIWNQAQLILTKRRPAPGQIKSRRHDFILSGVLWCVEHDCPMTAYGSQTHRYYTCVTRRKGSGCRLWKKEELEGAVLDAIKENIYSVDMIRQSLEVVQQEAMSEVRRSKKEADNLKAQVDKINRELENFYKAIAEGVSAGNLAEPIEERQRKKADIERQLVDFKQKTPRELASLEITDEAVEIIRRESMALLDADDPQVKRSFINTLIEKIKIADDHMEVIFYFLQSPATLPVQVAGVGLLYSQRITIPLERN